jgi:hypothetical protein
VTGRSEFATIIGAAGEGERTDRSNGSDSFKALRFQEPVGSYLWFHSPIPALDMATLPDDPATDAVLLLRPAGPSTVAVRVRGTGDSRHHHITEGQFREGNAPDIVSERFRNWSNLAVEEPTVYPLFPDATVFTLTGAGIGEARSESAEGEKRGWHILFPDTTEGRYTTDRSGEGIDVYPETDAPDDKTDEAKRALTGLTSAQNLRDLTYHRPTERAATGIDQDRLERELRRSVRAGYVLTGDGRRVEPDAPDSPLRKAGLI